jgi:hypothetical protein
MDWAVHPRLRARCQQLAFVENLLGDCCCCHRGWPSRIEGKMGDQFAQFVFGDAVVERALEMAAKLIGPLQCHQRGTGDEATVALGESRTFPDVAEQTFSVSSASLGTIGRIRSKGEDDDGVEAIAFPPVLNSQSAIV